MNRVSRQLVIVTSFVFMTLASGSVFAQDASTLFEEGAAMFYNGDYGSAILKFKQAHAAEPNSLFLYNISLCHAKLGQLRDAIEAGERAKITAKGGSPLNKRDATANESRITALRRILVARRFQPVAAPDVEMVEGSRWGPLGWVGVGTSAVGVGILVFAGITEVELQDKFSAYEQAAEDGNETEYLRLQGEVNELQDRGKILLYSGIGVTALGIGLIIIDLATPGEPQPVQVSLTPLLGGGAHAGFTYQF